MLRRSFGSQSPASENSQRRWCPGSSLAAMFSTIPRSGKSKRIRKPAARSSGPAFSSVSSSERASSRSSRNSVAEPLRLRVASTVPMLRWSLFAHSWRAKEGADSQKRRAALDQVLVQLLLDRLPHLLRDVEQKSLIAGRVGAVLGQVDRLAELDPPA